MLAQADKTERKTSGVQVEVSCRVCGGVRAATETERRKGEPVPSSGSALMREMATPPSSSPRHIK